jgi:acetyl-CoA synthetase
MYSIDELHDYESAKKKFRIEAPDKFNFGFDVIDKYAKDRSRLAMIGQILQAKRLRSIHSGILQDIRTRWSMR